jgi:two-component system cell cycle sensor histidine kinase/response regulator CckA
VALPGLVWEASELVLHGSSVSCNLATPPGLRDIHADKGQIFPRAAKPPAQRHAGHAYGRRNPRDTRQRRNSRRRKDGPTGRFVRLALIDTGEGITAEHLPRIIDPYFSTKRSGGLGLATVYSIVKKHRGRLEVQSNPGAGTTFRVWIPAAEPAAPVSLTANPAVLVPVAAR